MARNIYVFLFSLVWCLVECSEDLMNLENSTVVPSICGVPELDDVLQQKLSSIDWNSVEATIRDRIAKLQQFAERIQEELVELDTKYQAAENPAPFLTMEEFEVTLKSSLTSEGCFDSVEDAVEQQCGLKFKDLNGMQTYDVVIAAFKLVSEKVFEGNVQLDNQPDIFSYCSKLLGFEGQECHMSKFECFGCSDMCSQMTRRLMELSSAKHGGRVLGGPSLEELGDLRNALRLDVEDAKADHTDCQTWDAKLKDFRQSIDEVTESAKADTTLLRTARRGGVMEAKACSDYSQSLQEIRQMVSSDVSLDKSLAEVETATVAAQALVNSVNQMLLKKLSGALSSVGDLRQRLLAAAMLPLDHSAAHRGTNAQAVHHYCVQTDEAQKPDVCSVRDWGSESASESSTYSEVAVSEAMAHRSDTTKALFHALAEVLTSVHDKRTEFRRVFEEELERSAQVALDAMKKSTDAKIAGEAAMKLQKTMESSAKLAQAARTEGDKAIDGLRNTHATAFAAAQEVLAAAHASVDDSLTGHD